MNGRKRTIIWLAVLAVVLSLGVAPASAATSTSEVHGSVLGINNDPSGLNFFDDPLGGVRVAVFDAATGAFLKGTDTDAVGTYRISGLPDTAVKVRFTKTGWLTTWHGPVTLQPGTSTDLGEDVVYAEAVVTVSVLDGTDIVNAVIRLTVYDAETGAVLGAANSATNQVTLGGLPARPVNFRVTAPDYITAWAGPFTLIAGDHWTKPADYPYPSWWMDMNHADEIYGSVADAAGPLAGVKVLAIDAAGKGLSRVYTDAAGNFRMGMLAPNQTITVQFSKDGYRTANYPGTIRLEWQDAVGRQYDLGRTVLTSSRTAVSGSVLSQMDPLGGARVTVYDAATGAVVAAADTDASGSFRIGGLPAAPVKLRATKTGYLTGWFGGGTSLQTAHSYALTSGQELRLPWDAVDIPPEAVVTVDVLDETDVVSATIRLTVYDAQTGAVLAAKNSDTNQVTIGGLPARPVKFRVTAPDYITAWSGPFTLVAGQHWTKPADYPYPSWWMNMNHADAIYGSVADARGPLAGVKVLAVDAAGNGVSRVYTDAAGNYRISMLAPKQTVTVQFMKDGYRTVKYPSPIKLEWQEAVGRQYDLGRTTMAKK